MKANYQDDPFFQVPKSIFNTSTGDVELPINFYDTKNLISIFKADIRGITTLLQGTGFIPALHLGGSPLVWISFYEYRDTTVGSYNEVGVAIPVLREGAKKPSSNYLNLLSDIDNSQVGFYIVNLPVTTEAANVAGQEIWGYPKFVTEIPFSLGKNRFDAEVMDPQEGSIAKLNGKLNLGIKAPTLSGITYSHVGTETLRSTVNVRGNYKAHLFHSLKLTVGSSQHIMAKNLRALGLNNRRPLAVMTSHDFQSRLHAGVIVKQHE